jgi:hypothetical protein
MINLYYDNLNLGNGRTGDSVPVRYDITINKHLDWINLNYQLKLIKDFTESTDLNLYVIELFYVQRVGEIFENIPIETLNLLRNNKLSLLMYFPTEGFKLDLYDNWFLKMHEKLVEFGLANTNKYFIYNNLTIESQYQKMIESNEFPCTFNKVFFLPFFQLEYLNRLGQSTQKITEVSIAKRSKNFCCLNAKMRAHRLLLVSELSRRNLLENSYTSLLGDNPNFKFSENTIEHATNVLADLFKKTTDIPKESQEYLLKFAKEWQPMYLDDTTGIDLEAEVITDFFDNSFFSLVSETGMDHYLRISEKTFKPIANLHPFIVIGCHGTLDYLRSLGYQTFPELFDESYDEETNIPKRLLMVADQVEKFCKLLPDEKERRFRLVTEKLKHNYNLFFDVLPEKNKEKFRQIFISMR